MCLQNLLKKFDSNYKFCDEDYDDIKKVIDFIQINIRNLKPDTLEKVIFLLGSTGAGKSTLTNYLNYGDRNFIVADDNGSIKVKNESIVEIGDGNGSTTLFPNVWRSNIGTFLDCAGEGDSSGILAEIINSYVKMRIASNVSSAKIIFVTKASSLDHNGGYGITFKESLDKNAQFLGNLDIFQNSTGLVVTGAGVKKSALEVAINSIKKIIEHHKNIDTYKNILRKTIDNKNIATFSKPPEALDVGEDYQPPEWNLDQQKVISDMINKIPFSQIPTKDFFNTSSTSETRETMAKTLKILKFKAGSIIKRFIQTSLPFQIFSVELKPFAKFLQVLMSNHKSDFINYCKILKYNNYLKAQIDDNMIQKLNQDINFVSQFVNKDSKENQNCKQDWGDIAQIKDKLKDVFKQLEIILSEECHRFLKSVTKKYIITKTSKHSIQASTKFEKLYLQYKNLYEIQKMGKNQQSMYYKDVQKKEFKYTTNDVESLKKINDIIIQTFKQIEMYQSTQQYIGKETKYRPVTKFRTESYSQPVTKTRTEQYDDTEAAPVRNTFKQIFTLGMGDQARDHVRKTRQVAYTQFVQKTRQVPYTDTESYQEQVILYRPITKEREITKANVYSKYIIRERIEDQYKKDFEKSEQNILKIRKLIIETIRKYSKGKLGVHHLEILTPKDKFEEKYLDLLQKIQKAEYENYFAENPHNSLEEELTAHQIENLVSNFSNL